MEIRESRQGKLHVLKPVGRLDSVTSGLFQSMLLAAVAAPGTDVVVDLSQVDYVSSAGLRALMAAVKVKATGSRVAAAGLNACVREAFAVSRFTHVLPIFADVGEAAGGWPPGAAG